MNKKPMSERKYANLIHKLSDHDLKRLEERAALAGATPREYVERQEQRRQDQHLISRAVWVDLRSLGGI